MKILLRAAALLAAGAAGWALAKHKAKQTENTDPQVVYLDDDEAVIVADESAEPQPVRAEVKSCFRRMDPLTLTGGSDVTFLLEDGTEVQLPVSGEGGLHLAQGERGVLTWSGRTLIRFEKDSGEVISGMFYVPAQEESTDE